MAIKLDFDDPFKTSGNDAPAEGIKLDFEDPFATPKGENTKAPSSDNEPGWIPTVAGGVAAGAVGGTVQGTGGVIQAAEEITPQSAVAGMYKAGSMLLGGGYKYLNKAINAITGLEAPDNKYDTVKNFFDKMAQDTMERDVPGILDTSIADLEEKLGFDRGFLGKAIAGKGKQWTEALAPEGLERGSAKYQVAGALTSVGMMIPAIAAGILTKNPGTTLEVMSALSGGQDYVEKREDGMDVPTALGSAMINRATEKYTEKIPLGVLFNKNYSIGKRLLMEAATDIPGELVATTIEQGLIDTATTNPNKTWGEFLSDLKDTAIQSAIMSGTMGASMHPIVKWAEKQENRNRSHDIQNAVMAGGHLELAPNDLLRVYMDSEKLQQDLPDDAGLSASMATMKAELEKRGVWPEDTLSRDIESKMAELDEKLGNPVQESSEAVMQTERGEPNVEGQLQAEAERQVTPTEPILQPGEDIETVPPMADTSQMIASSPPSSFFSMPNITMERKAEEKASPTLPLTELSEEGTANPPSTPEKTSQEVTEEKVGEVRTSDNLVPKKGSEFGLKGLNENRWTVDGNIMGNTPEEAVAEYNKVQAIAKDEADQQAIYDTIIPKLQSGDYTEADIKKITSYGKTTTSTKQMDGILMSLGLTHKQAGQARKKAGDVDTTSKGAILYDVGRTVETAREMGLLGEKKVNAKTKILKVFSDKKNGLEVHVAKVEKGFSVAVMDIDSGKFFDEVKIYPTDKKAIEAAKALTKKPVSPIKTAEEKPKAKKPSPKPKPQKEVTLESHVRKNKVNFNIPGHSNKEAISDGLLSFVKNDAVNADKAAEELQGMGLLGATPDEYATAGDYLYAELQRIVYNRKNKIIQSLTAEEEAAIKEFKEASLNEGYDESDIEAEVGAYQGTGKKEAYSIKDSEAHGEAQSILEDLDEDFVKEEETPTTELFDTSEMFTLSGNQPVEQKTMKVPEKKGERLLDVEKQTTDELRDRLSGEKAKREFEEGRLKTSTGQRGGENETGASKTTFGDTTAPVESDRSLGILKGEFEREFGKSLDMGWATQVRVPNVLAEGVERISRVFGKEVVWLELADSTPFFNGVVSDQIPDKVFINAKTKEPYLFILGHEMLHQMKFQSPELYSSLLAETKKYMKDRKGIARLSELNREETYADLVGEAFTSEDYWNHLQKKNPTLFEKAIQIAKDIIDKAVKALGIRNVLSPQYFSDVKKAQTIIADIMDKYAQETGVNLSVGTLPKGQSLSSKDRQALVTDILNILSEGSTINFVGTIDPNRADIQKALTEWKKGNPDSAFTIEGMHRKVVVDGNKMASLIEIAMKGSSDIKLTAWHEAWHSIDEIFLTANEQKILAEKLTPDIEKQANIFAKYAADQKHLLPKSARSIFERVKAFFDKLGNYLKGRGFTNAEDVFDRALRGELKERTKRWTGEGEAALQISAMHGSPFAFDRFTTDRIGSGEGSQMFGWGLYFTDKDSIAKHYAENLGKGEIRINGRTQIQASDQLKRFVSSWLTAGNFDYVKNSLNQAINGYENAVGKEYYTLQMGHDLDVLREIKREIDKGEQSFYDNVKYKESSRNLYNVTLHKGKDPSEYHYMDWEKSIGKELATVIENAVGKEYLDKKYFSYNNDIESFNGATAYNFLEDYLADGNDLPGVTVEDYNYPKAVSLFLLRNGVDGIKYPAGTLSGVKSEASNYVVFDENAVTIDERVSFKMGEGKFTSQQDLDNQAIAEGFTVGPVWHGSPDFIGEKFDTKYLGRLSGISRGGFSFTKDKARAEAYKNAKFSDPEQVAIDDAVQMVNDARRNTTLTKEEQTRLEKETGYEWESMQFDGRNFDTWEEAQDTFQSLSSWFAKAGKADLAKAMWEASQIEVREQQPRLVRAFLKNPRIVIQERSGDEIYLIDDPSQIKEVPEVDAPKTGEPSFKIAPAIKELIGLNTEKAGNPAIAVKDGSDDFRRQFKEVLGKDYSLFKAHLYLPFFKGHGPNAEPMWKRAFDNTEAGREKRSDLNTHYVRKMHDFFDMPKEKVRNIEKVLVEGDAVLGQRINDLISEAITAKQGGNLELAGQLREQAKAIQLLNRYSDEELINGITLRNGEVVKLTPQEAKVYADVRTAFDQMHRDQYKHQIEMVFGKHRDKAWYSSMIDLFEDRPDSPEFTSDKKNTLKALNKLALDKIRGKKAETIAKNRAILMEALKSHISTVSGMTDQNELDSAAGDMLKAYREEKVLMNAIKKARNRMGQQVAYFPRVREKGNVYLNIFKEETKTDKNGDEKTFKTMIHSQVVKNPEEARQLWEQYRSNPDRKNENLSYELGAVNKETDSTYVGVNDMNLQRVLDNAIERIRTTRNLDSGPILNGLKLSMVEAVANEMKSRGFGKSNITRRLNLIEGYKTSDLQKVALDYITGMTGMMTKQETAMNFHDILKEIPRDKPKLYNDIAKYAQDMLRNQNTFDRASGKARGITFIYYLGGNLKSALIQLTQNHVTGIPKLAEKMREWGVKGFAEAKYHKAMADASRVRVNKDTGEVTGKSINKWEARLLTEFLHRGNTADQYMQYITGRMQNELGQKFGAVMNVLSKPFGKMETFNRESASLAMFRMAWEHYSETIPDLEERYAKAYEEAKEYVNFTHFAYGKENLPRVATGGDLASVTARTLLTFRSFNHNYLQSIFGSKDWKTMAHSLAYVALFGGMMGLPFIKDLSDLLEKLTGKSYTKSAREVMRKFGGRTLETFGVQGLPALAGMNISGSLAIGIPLVGETPTDTVTGVMGGMYNKAKKGVQFGAKGELYKAAESILPEMVANPMKALRMSDVGKEYLGTPGYATTASGKPIFDENGKPLKMSVADMALKTIGINPSEYSMKTEAQRSASNIEEYFSDWKTSIYETYRAGRTNHDSKAVSKALRQIREYNQAIIEKGVMGLIPRIKMSNVVKASKVEMTKKQKREALYKRNYLAS